LAKIAERAIAIGVLSPPHFEWRAVEHTHPFRS
jgi:hypothetical protein